MENPPLPSTASARPIPPALGYSGAALALWIFRRPILALTGAATQLTLAMLKPALLILGALKVADLLQTSRNPKLAKPPFGTASPKNEEAQLVPTHPLTPTSSSGSEV